MVRKFAILTQKLRRFRKSRTARTRTTHLIVLFTAILLSLFCTSCSKIWGEKQVPPQVIETQTGPSAECGAIQIFLEGSEQESIQILDCWTTKLNDLWNQISGKKHEELNDHEIQLLIKKGIIRLSDNFQKAYDQISAVRVLLGLPAHSFRKKDVDRWITWLRENQSNIRFIFQSYKEGSIHYDVIETFILVLKSFFEQTTWAFNSESLAKYISYLIDSNDTMVRQSILPAVKAGADLLLATCPNLPIENSWDSKILSSCFSKIGPHFKPVASWFEYLLNPVVSDLPDIKKIQEALAEFTWVSRIWWQQDDLHPLHTRIWIELLKSLGAEPADGLIESLRFIRRLKSRITEELIYPEGIIHIFKVIRQFEEGVLEGLPAFFQATKEGRCKNAEAQYWKNCVLLESDESIRSSKMFQLALRVRNPHFGQSIVPLNGGNFSQIMFFNALVDQIFLAFDDDKDGLMSAITGEDNEIFNILYVVSQSWNAIERSIDNIKRKLAGRPLDHSPLRDTFNGLKLETLSQLIAIMSDVLVVRDPEDRNEFEKLISHFINVAPHSKVHLDRLATLAAILFVDALGDFRRSYLNQEGLQLMRESNGLFYINRKDVQKALPSMVLRHFPRTYKSCLKHGFQQSCGSLFNEVLPEDPKLPNKIAVRDLDILTLVAGGGEGLLDRCDYNLDGSLRWQILDGEDELDCGFTKLKDVIIRLLDSKIIHASDKTAIKSTLEFINATFFTRVIGKIALIKGSKPGVLSWLDLPLFWAYDSATLGSMYRLFTDLVVSPPKEQDN